MNRKNIIIFNGLQFASPRHLMKHFRKYKLHKHITIKYLTQCYLKEQTTIKGVAVSYLGFNLSDPVQFGIYTKIKSLTRSGEGYDSNTVTPIDYFANTIVPLLTIKNDPIKAAIQTAIDQGIGTEKDYEELIKNFNK